MTVAVFYLVDVVVVIIMIIIIADSVDLIVFILGRNDLKTYAKLSTHRRGMKLT